MYTLKCFRYRTRGTINNVITWDQCLIRARENVSYVKMYMDLLSNIVCPSNLTGDLKELKNKVEWERGYDELRSLREVAMFRIKSPSAISVNEKLSNTGGSTLFQWFPQWWGWYSTTENLEDVKTPCTEEKPKIDPQLGQIEDEILDVIADTVENNTILRRDTVFGQFNFSLNEGNIRLNSVNASAERYCHVMSSFHFKSTRSCTSMSRIFSTSRYNFLSIRNGMISEIYFFVPENVSWSYSSTTFA